ncbi:A Q resistance [Scheffersomyces xylosifermentans]|uniref:A Q resistance n=1 Tax=Scheffersomyces xylosifermentans TaxID=1304137 RepID=UPI00315CFF02
MTSNFATTKNSERLQIESEISDSNSNSSLGSDFRQGVDLGVMDGRQFGYYNETVPLELTSVNNDAVTREITRIQSRRSSNFRNVAATNKSSNANLQQELDIEKGQGQSKISTEECSSTTFSSHTRLICVVLASISGFLSPLSSLAMLPAVPEIADQFNTTGEVINVSNAIYCVFMSISPCIFSPCSDIYGRRFTFIACALGFTVSTILVAVSQDLAMFYIFRCLTALFGSSFFSVGAHIIGDLFVPVERATYMTWILSGAMVGTAIGPVGGGIIVTYTSWTVIFFVLAGIGLVVTVLAFFFLPETCKQTKHSIVLAEAKVYNEKKKFVFILYNPLRIIDALKYPNLFIDGFITIVLVYNMYNLLTPIRYIVNPRFNLTRPLYSGLFYLAPGLGYLVGTFFGGRWADHVVKKYIKKRGRRVPEDRLRTILIPIGFVYPVSILIYGWSIEKEKGGMAVPIIFMFLSGIAQTCIFPAINTYCVDSMPEIGGDGIASSYFSRYLAGGVASATCLRSVQNIGVGWSCTISAFTLWLGFGLALYLIYFGESVREKALVKYGLREADDIHVK